MVTSIAVITGLSYKGTDLQDWDNGIYFEVRDGQPYSSPEVRGESRTMPYRRGMLYAARRANRLPIQLEGFVRGVGVGEAAQRADTASLRAQMFALFDTEGGPGALLCTTEDGITHSANAYPELFLPNAYPDVPTFWTCSVRLIAEDPPEWVPSGS